MRRLHCFSLLSCLFFSPAFAGSIIDLTAEASLPAANDLVKAVVFVEANGRDPAELASRVNQEISEALRLIKSKPAMSVKSGNQQTYPVYGNNRRIESWRMRSELMLESTQVAQLSELLGRLQKMNLALGEVSQSPSDSTRLAVEEAALRDALKAFERRADIIAATLGKPYRIKQLRIHQGGSNRPLMAMRAAPAMMSADAAPAPVEAGDSQLTVSVSGQIELTD
jgi:predicted secreted protein